MKVISKKNIAQYTSSPFGVMFHHFHDQENSKYGQGSLSITEFEKIIIFLKKNFNIINPKDWLSKIEKKQFKKKDICLTFDDGILSQYKIGLKILNKYNLKAFWFVYSSVFLGKLNEFEIQRKFRSKYYKNFDEFFDEFLNNFNKYFDFKKNKKFKAYYYNMKKFFSIYSDKDIKFRFLRDCVLEKKKFNNIISKMMVKKKTNKLKLSKNLWLKNLHLKKLSKDGHEIGMHAYNHPYQMSKLSYKNQLNELTKNYMHLKKTTKKIPLAISYPNGSFNHNTLDILGKLNIRCGFISSMKNYKNCKKKNYLFKRLDHSIILKELIK